MKSIIFSPINVTIGLLVATNALTSALRMLRRWMAAVCFLIRVIYILMSSKIVKQYHIERQHGHDAYDDVR